VSGSLVSPELRSRVRGIAVPIAVGLGRLGLTPNALTLIGFAIAVVAAFAAAQQAWIAAGLLVIFGGVFDLFDGALARATNKVSRLGAFMDSVFDRWGEGVVYVGIVVGSVGFGYRAVPWLAGMAMSAAFMVSYARAKAENLGFASGRGIANVGLAPREVRIVILTVGLLVSGLAGTACTDTNGGFPCSDDWVAPAARVLEVTLALITVLAAITTIQRIVHVVRQSASEEHE
jgi:phosphatidylglycerophosphate synthase